MTSRVEWSNWAGNVTAFVDEVVAPVNEAAVQEIVRAAAKSGRRVKAIGTAHSFSRIAVSDSVVMTTNQLDATVTVHGNRVTVGGGMKLRALNDFLATVGLAMRNLGDVDYQSVAGAIATATHGTGKQFGGIATNVVGMRIVNGHGDVVVVDDPDVLRGTAVHLGALGIVTEVTLACVPAFTCFAVEQPVLIDDLIDEWPAAIEANDHIEFWWIPGSEWALVRANQRVASSGTRGSIWHPPVPSKTIPEPAQTILGMMGKWQPNATSTAEPHRYNDRSDRVFCSERGAALEMEYSAPATRGMECLQHVRDTLGAHPEWKCYYPVEVRYTQGDDLWMSTANGRDSMYIAVHEDPARAVDPYFASVEPFIAGVDGRPHWGKMHTQTASTLRARYDHWDEFTALRNEFDPQRTFGSAALESLLGD